ncbi:MFS transporter [Pseudomonas sp. LB-090624]|uniref:MFS transporter n=1 Tax=Pseudomonas sp. LB-090624 TaxID=2213079 RepID=UPI000D80E6FF|nr:MFS transporter [Pseudomonas sp. LB-090624]
MSMTRSTQIAFLVAATFFMENLDATVIVTALPEMARSFAIRPVDLSIGMSSYLLAMAAFIPLSGWVADRLGARTTFAAAIAAFTLASLLCGLSYSLETFVVARVMQGISGALMVPVGRLAVLRATEKKDLVRTIGYITVPGLVAPVLGPPVGALMVTHATWPWIFYLNIPFGIIAFIFACYLIDNHRSERRMPFDWTGFILLSGTCVALLAGFEMLGHAAGQSWSGAWTIVAAMLLAVLSVWHLRKAPFPLLKLDALGVQTFRLTFFSGSLYRVCISSLPFLLPLMFQLAFGLSALTAGSLMIAVFAGNLAMKAVTTAVLKRWGFRQVLLLNGWLGVLCIGGCALLEPSTSHELVVAWLFIGGLSRSLQFTAYNNVGFSEISTTGMRDASTLFSMAFQLSMGLGIAVGALILRFAMLLHENVGVETAADFQFAFLLVALLAAVATGASWTLRRDAGASVIQG